MSPVKYNPSAAAFATGLLVHTEYNSGCPRKIILAAHGVRESLKQDVKNVGQENEDQYEKYLIDNAVEYEREKVIKTDGDIVNFSGRVDFVIGEQVVELKSTRSATKRTRLKNQNPYIENIAQIVAYMVELDKHKGQLIYTYYGYDKRKKKDIKENYEFAITVDQYGDIFVNGIRYQFTVHDHLNHRTNVFNCYRDEVLAGPCWSRPNYFAKPFGSPCNYCPFKNACRQFDAEIVNSTEEFVNTARECLTVLYKEEVTSEQRS